MVISQIIAGNPILGPRKKDFSNPPSELPRITIMLKTQENTEQLANYLVDKFQSPEFKPLFLKVAWRLDKGTIDRLVGTAFEMGTNKRAYFISLVKREKAYYDN